MFTKATLMIVCVLAFAFLTLVISVSAQGAVIGDLVALYDFNGNTNDTSGNAYDASLIGGAAVSGDSLGYSSNAGDRSLDLGSGATEYAKVTGAIKLATATTDNKMAVSFWQYNIGNGAGGNVTNSAFRVVSTTASGRGFQAHTPWSDGTLYFDHNGATAPVTRLTKTGLGTSLIDGWHHIALQVDNGTKEIWIDGAKVSSQASGAGPIPTFTNEIRIGADLDGGGNWFRGRIDEFAVWSDTLTQTQIESLAGGTSTADLMNIPEPATMSLLALGGLAILKRRRL
ncbi:MAG: LamG domain-containing protein [Phycisphaerales bacterium]|jgi:hypothetical protein|nr:LamG domain-containing protein [Phycisphaerales bacterium]